MHVLDVNEIFWVTFYTFDRIMELWWKNWPDAYALYTKLVKQSRIQQTNQTKSLNAFLREWLGWWDERLKKARHVLKQLWLIDDIIVRDKLGKINWHYVRVNFLINENKVRNTCMTYDLSTEALNQDVAKPTSGQTDTNALSTKYINAWSTKNKSNSPKQSKQKLGEHWSDGLTLSGNVMERLVEYNNNKKNKFSNMTQKWFDLIIKDLKRLWYWTDEWMIAVLQQSIKNGWEWLFEVKWFKPTIDYENDLWAFYNEMKRDYEWLKNKLWVEKFMQLKQKALRYAAENKLL